MARTLLFACDLSAENRSAFGRAIRLASEQGAHLDILHVLDPYLPHRVLHDLESAVVADIQSIMTDLREDYAFEEPAHLIQTVTGAPYAEIIREAHERQADMIILGTHRKRGHPDLIGGTTLARVLRSAPCPVLIISQPPARAWHDILVPVDFSLACRRTLHETLCRFPEARLKLLHAWNIPGERELGSDSGFALWRDQEVSRLRRQLEQDVDQLMSEFEQVPELELVLEQGNPLEVLMSHLRHQPPDLLALSNHNPSEQCGQIILHLLSELHYDIMVCRAW
ncbi:universal stress protein [Halomonas binhaiensis]|uniref:Universal stress protein n=1 Tax=Halomonas binhaiensis TaxID=2562282 RepID=A0A5C1NL49_9GAMM|nr:universal stress protein [Halomonas binhaiensis]QEM83520.1 universal stress protein [Halomonas binhaiensis]